MHRIVMSSGRLQTWRALARALHRPATSRAV